MSPTCRGRISSHEISHIRKKADGRGAFRRGGRAPFVWSKRHRLPFTLHTTSTQFSQLISLLFWYVARPVHVLTSLNKPGFNVFAIASRHSDGELISGTLKHFDIDLIRGAGAGQRKKDRGGAFAFSLGIDDPRARFHRGNDRRCTH